MILSFRNRLDKCPFWGFHFSSTSRPAPVHRSLCLPPILIKVQIKDCINWHDTLAGIWPCEWDCKIYSLDSACSLCVRGTFCLCLFIPCAFTSLLRSAMQCQIAIIHIFSRNLDFIYLSILFYFTIGVFFWDHYFSSSWFLSFRSYFAGISTTILTILNNCK